MNAVEERGAGAHVVENTAGEFVASFSTRFLADFFVGEGSGCYRHRTPAPAGGVREGCVGTMTPERATYFLERFKREEKWLGPHEQWALDYTIAALASPTPDSSAVSGSADMPWGDLKVAFGVDAGADDIFDRFDNDRDLPTGWELNETDSSGARMVAVFRVDHAPTLEEGRIVEAILAALTEGQ